MKKILLSIFCCMLAVIGLQAQSYVKVTTAPADWEGDYLIVYETNSVAFNGGLSTLDATSNTIDVTIVDNEIAATDATNAAKFTIEAVSGGYAIKSASGNYIGVSSNSNGLKQTTTSTTYKHSLSIDASANAAIKAEFSSSTMALRFNKANNQNRFRYFKNAGQEAIQLYKYTEGTGGGEEDTTPVLVADVDALAFKAALNTTTDAQTVTLTVKNLDAVTYTCDNAAFGVTDNGDNTYDVTFTAPAEVGTTNGTLTFSADGVDDVVVNLTGVATNEVTIWEEDFTDDTTPYALTYTDGGSTTKLYNETNAGGTSPELLISKSDGAMSVDITDLKGCSGDLTLTFLSNHADYVEVSTTTNGVTIKENSDGNYTVTVPSGVASLNLTFTNTTGSNTRVDDFLLVGAPSAEVTVAAPTFNPVAGAVAIGTEVELECVTADATIYYAIGEGAYVEYDGTAIVVNEETTINAYAKLGDAESAIVSATYTIAQVAAPTFNPAAGEVEAGTEVTISAATGATIYYAIGEADFEEYTTAIVVNEAVTIKAYATQVGYIDSEIVTSAYTIKADAPDAGGEGTGVYELITDVNDLIVGRNIILVGVNNESYYAMDVQNNNNRAGVSVDVNGDNTITPAATTAIIELGQEGANYTFSTPDGYLYAASNSSNQLKSQASNDANGQWSISVTSSGVASIIAQGNKSRNVMQFNYNGGSPLFACYASASQKPVYIYQEIVNSTDPAIAVDPEELAFGEKQVGTVNELAFTATAKNFVPTNTTYTISGDAVFALSGDNSKVVFTAPIQTAAAEYNATVTVTMDELSVNIPVTAALLAPVMTADAECNLGSRQIETSNTAAATVAYSLTNIGELTPEVTCSLANGTVFTAAVVEGGVEIGYAAGAEIALYEDVLTISAKLSDDVTLTTTTAIKMTTFDSNPALIANPATVELSVVATYSVGGSVTLTANNITDDAETDDVDESVITYALSGANADAFEVEYLDYEDGLMYYGVTFNAPATAGIYTATLTFSSEYYGVESSVTLQGTSVLAGMVQVAYEPFNFEGKPAGYNDAVQILPSETGTFPYVYDWVIMDTPIYAGSSFLKFGSSSDYDVQMKSTNILANIPAGATFIVYLDIANWSSPVDSNPESSGVTITYNGVSQSVNPVDGEVGSGGTYSEEHFTTPIQFTFTKAEGVEDLIISSAGGRKILDNLTIYSQASDDQVMVIATYPKVGATAVARETTNAMSISFNKSVESVDMNKITINGNWVVAEGDEREVLLNRIENNTVFFMVNSPEMEYGKDANGQVIRASNCLTDMATEYTVNVAEGAVTFVEATPAPRKGMARAAAVSPAYSWSFTTQSMATDIDNISVAGALAYNGREVVAADSAAMIEVYNMSGVLVAAERGRADLNALAGGVYVVRCGNDVMKVVR